MGKHAGTPDPNEEIKGPYGDGPHPTPEQSEQKAQEFEDQWKSYGGK